jgi:uncharacterized delta-60 repeat protein
MIGRPRLVDAPRPTRRRDARKAGQPRRPTIEALEVRSLLSVAGGLDYSFAPTSSVPGIDAVYFGTTPTSGVITTAEALQPDGKFVVVGDLNTSDYTTTPPTISSTIEVTRLDADGSVDTTFGTNGAVALPAAVGSDVATAVAIQSDGAIDVLANVAPLSAPATSQIALYQLLADGSLDTSFGTNGVVDFQFQVNGHADTGTTGTTLTIQPDHKILVGGGDLPGGVIGLARFNSDGSSDSSFGNSGQALIPITIESTTLAASTGVAGLTVQPSGAIDFDATVLVSSTAASDIAVGQLTASGALDSTFGIGGLVLLANTPAAGSSSYDTAGPLTLLPSGQWIVTGAYFTEDSGLTTSTTHFDVYRLNANGSVDTSFGTMGEATPGSVTSPVVDGSYPEVATSIVVQPNGQIVVGGSITTNATFLFIDQLIARLNADGSTDKGFGIGGLDESFDEQFGYQGIKGLAIQGDGKILALSTGEVVRLLPTGASNDFDEDGTSDLAVELTNTAVPVVAYQTASQATPANFVGIGIPGAGQTLPAPGAYDGGGIDEVGVYLPSFGAFAVKPFNDPSTNGAGDYIDYIGPTGAGKAIPAPADYTGAGYTEVGVYDTTTGSFIYSTAQPSNVVAASSASTQVTVPFGIPGAGQSIPVPADYYGTGQDDIAVYLAASGVWAIQDPTGKTPGEEIAFGPAGIGNAIPVPADYDNSGHIELGLYLPSLGAFAYLPYNGGPAVFTAFGMAGTGNSIPMPGDYDGSGHTELAVYMPSLDAFAYRPYNGGPDVIKAFGAPGSSIPFSVVESGVTPFVAGDYYASDGTDVVTHYSQSGAILGTFSVTGPAAVGGLKGVAFNPANGLLYASSSNANGNLTVLAMDSLGTVEETYVTASPTGGNISFGTIAFDNTGNFYVGDGVGVHKFTAGILNAGTVIYNQSSNGAYQIAVLPDGDLLVVGDYEVSEITPTGTLVSHFTPASGAPGFVNLRGVAFDASTDSLYVSMLGFTGYYFQVEEFNYATGALLASTTFTYADSLFVTSGGDLLVGSRTQAPALFDSDLNFITQLDGGSQLFATQSGAPGKPGA